MRWLFLLVAARGSGSLECKKQLHLLARAHTFPLACIPQALGAGHVTGKLQDPMEAVVQGGRQTPPLSFLCCLVGLWAQLWSQAGVGPSGFLHFPPQDLEPQALSIKW